MIYKNWPHAPIHRLGSDSVYIVTGATLHKALLFSNPQKLTMLEHEILTLAKHYFWQLEAWAVFTNHYHLIARGGADATSLDKYLKHIHGNSARNLNVIDHSPGRQVWYNFWETRLTYERSYLARLNYVHQNAVKHGLVNVASNYQWCSAAWFERTASPATVKTIYSFKTEKLRIDDDY
jgi:putative transposase